MDNIWRKYPDQYMNGYYLENISRPILYPEHKYQNEYNRSIYVYMHIIFSDIKAKCTGIHDLCQKQYKYKYLVHSMYV